jgi:hypothetical protein
VTTFRFDRNNEDAFEAALLDSLVSYVASESCRPALEWRQ